MIKLRVSGHSDDLIEIDGDLEEEFTYNGLPESAKPHIIT